MAPFCGTGHAGGLRASVQESGLPAVTQCSKQGYNLKGKGRRWVPPAVAPPWCICAASARLLRVGASRSHLPLPSRPLHICALRMGSASVRCVLHGALCAASFARARCGIAASRRKCGASGHNFCRQPDGKATSIGGGEDCRCLRKLPAEPQLPVLRRPAQQVCPKLTMSHT